MGDADEEKTPGTGPRSWGATRRMRIRIWAIRSVIVILATYIFVLLGVASWVVWLALAYVALTLGVTFWMTREGD